MADPIVKQYCQQTSQCKTFFICIYHMNMYLLNFCFLKHIFLQSVLQNPENVLNSIVYKMLNFCIYNEYHLLQLFFEEVLCILKDVYMYISSNYFNYTLQGASSSGSGLDFPIMQQQTAWRRVQKLLSNMPLIDLMLNLVTTSFKKVKHFCEIKM